MLISRGIGVVKRLQTLKVANSFLPARNSHVWSYRKPAPEPSKAVLYTAEFCAGFMWWWILWHLWHEPTHITGEFEYPNTSAWTNEELGIPSDDDE